MQTKELYRKIAANIQNDVKYIQTYKALRLNANLPYTLTLINHNPKTNPNPIANPKSNNSKQKLNKQAKHVRV